MSFAQLITIACVQTLTAAIFLIKAWEEENDFWTFVFFCLAFTLSGISLWMCAAAGAGTLR
jgi:hypothetical protein